MSVRTTKVAELTARLRDVALEAVEAGLTQAEAVAALDAAVSAQRACLRVGYDPLPMWQAARDARQAIARLEGVGA